MQVERSGSVEGMWSLNLELKARDPDPPATIRVCSLLGAVEGGDLRQRDTYFDVPAGRLKLRESLKDDDAELIFYERPAAEGVRPSRYWRIAVPSPEPLRELLCAALGVLGVVEKTRQLFWFRHVRIHVDSVDGLGSFIELEAVQPDGAEIPACDEALAEVMTALRCDDRPLIGDGYLDLLQAARSDSARNVA